MKKRRGSSLWGVTDGLACMVCRFVPGDLVVPVGCRQGGFLGVVKEVLPKLNKINVCWNGGSLVQHDPDEIVLEQYQSPLVRTRMAKTRRGRNCFFKGLRKAQHLQNVKTLPTLTKRELTRALRDAIIAEEGAINQYETIADSIDNERVRKVLQEIADEERTHVGELQTLLNELLEDEVSLMEEGAKEVTENNKLAGVVPGIPDGTGPHGYGRRNRQYNCPFNQEGDEQE